MNSVSFAYPPDSGNEKIKAQTIAEMRSAGRDIPPSFRNNAFLKNKLILQKQQADRQREHVIAERIAAAKDIEAPQMFVAATEGTGSISGKVTDEAGNGIAEVSVYVNDSSVNYNGVTDSNGEYTVNGLPEGSYKIEFYVFWDITDSNGNSYIGDMVS